MTAKSIDKALATNNLLNEKTKQNLRRKSYYIDDVQMIDGKPLFSWIDINVTELCNRKCIFCPRVDEAEYPNQHLHMPVSLARKIATELKQLNYQGVVVFSGFGEPMSCPNLIEIIAEFNAVCRIELVTNGDYLNTRRMEKLVAAGVDYFVVSLYDGEHQIAEFKEKFAQAGIDSGAYILRDRWHSEEDNFGLKLTNRAGTILAGDQLPIDITHPCFYTAYSLTIDWNGDVLLCMQDWNKKVKFGNVALDSLLGVWHSKPLDRFRKTLFSGKRTCSPCSGCNTDGTLHGFNHVDLWKPVLYKSKESRGE